MSDDITFLETLRISIEKDDYSFSEGWSILSKFKANGGKKEDALKYLTHLRTDYTENEIVEDRVLELLDSTTGFCSSHIRAWGD